MEKVALVFTDIEGSTRLLEKDPSAYAQALRLHHQTIRRIVSEHHGQEFQDAGDSLLLAFPQPDAALKAASAIQESLAALPWPAPIGPLRVRVAVHYAKAEFREGQFRGPAVHFTSRLLSSAHGGQIVCSESLLPFAPNMSRLGLYRLRGFEQASEIYQSDSRGSFPPLKADQARRHNLPVQRGTFVGRTRERAELHQCLLPHGAPCLVSLTGPGGIGKTRLALHAAQELLEAFDHGVFFVPLSEVGQASGILHAILSALAIDRYDSANPMAALADFLCQMPTLIILDGFEHLAGEGAAVVASLQARLPNLHLLVSSRARLGLPGETELPIPALEVPEKDATTAEELTSHASVQLLIQRAPPAFTLNSQNTPAIAEICRLLAGLPLAIELAAPRLQVFTAAELLDHLLKENCGAGMEAVFAWSYRLLPDEIAHFLAIVASFRGGWTAAASAQVAGLPSPGKAVGYLHYLLTCSLIQATESDQGMRFGMLEPLRHLAEDRLTQGKEAIWRAHAEYFQDLLRNSCGSFGTKDELPVSRTWGLETANILTAVSRETRNPERIAMCVRFHLFASSRGCNRELRSHLVTEREGGGIIESDLRLRGWNAAGFLDSRVGDLDAAESAFRQAILAAEDAGDEFGQVSSRFNLAMILGRKGAYEQALLVSKTCLDFFRQRDARSECLAVLTNLAEYSRRLGHLTEAQQWADEALGLATAAGDSAAQATLLNIKGEISLARKDWRSSARYLTESLRLKIGRHEEFGHHEILCPLAETAFLANNLPTVAFLYGAAIHKLRKTNTTPNSENKESLQRIESQTKPILGHQTWNDHVEMGTKATNPSIMEKAEALWKE